MNYRTFIVCLFLAIPIQLDKIDKDASLGVWEISTALVVAILIALFWAFIAGWVRRKFFANLSDSYITKIQVFFGLIGILLIINVFLNPKELSGTRELSMLEESSLTEAGALERSQFDRGVDTTKG